jgi:hypothetical protein
MPRAPEVTIVIVGDEEERDQFQDGFRRNGRGNLSQVWDGCVLTVFRRGSSWSWSIKGDDGVRFSRQPYEAEGEAIGALAEEFGL